MRVHKAVSGHGPSPSDSFSSGPQPPCAGLRVSQAESLPPSDQNGRNTAGWYRHCLYRPHWARTGHTTPAAAHSSAPLYCAFLFWAHFPECGHSPQPEHPEQPLWRMVYHSAAAANARISPIRKKSKKLIWIPLSNRSDQWINRCPTWNTTKDTIQAIPVWNTATPKACHPVPSSRFTALMAATQGVYNRVNTK